MVIKRSSEDSLAIHAANFGGLNTTGSAFNVPSTDCTGLLNFDTDINGKLTRRQGTRVIERGSKGMQLHSFVSNKGLELTLGTFQNDAAIYQANNDDFVTIKSLANLFKFFNNKIKFLNIPEENLRITMFTERETTKQITLFESSYIPDTAGLGFNIATLDWIPNQDAADLIVGFRNGVYDSTISVVYGASASTILSTNAFSILDEVVIMQITWQWWAEAELWDGANFRSTVPRFGANEADKLVQVPAAINDSLEDIREPYGIKLYSRFSNDLGANEYNRVSVPTRGDQYSWSNGTFSFINAQYLWDAVTTNFATRFFVNFGQESNFVEYDNIEVLDFNSTLTRVRIPSHEFTDGDVVRIRQIDVLGQSTTLNRWVAVVNEDWIEFHDSPDINNTLAISISYNSVEELVSGDVNTANNRFENITNANTKFPGGSPFKVLPDAGGTSMPGGFVVDRVYYGIGTAAGYLLPYLEKNTEFRININSAVDCIIYEVNPIIIFKRLYNTVTFNRARRIPFNGGDGIASLWYDVILNDFLGLARNDNLSSTGYVLLTDRNDLSSRLNNNNDLGQYIAFINALDEDDELMLVNAENQWSGTGAKTSRFTLASATSYLGGYYPIYGFSQFADFKRGVFPATGEFYQERLYLSGFSSNPSLVVASGTSNQYREQEYYNYFQITDALQGDPFEPFDFVLNNPGVIYELKVWQELLFIFTQNAVYRNQQPVTPQVRSFGLVSNSGVYTRNAIAVADNLLLYVSFNGVYSIPLVESNEYRTNELSLKIRDLFIDNEFLGLHFHNQRKKVFLYSADLVYVYDLRSESWTQYYTYAGWNCEDFVDYYDVTLGWLLLTSTSILQGSTVSLYRWFDPSYIDYAEDIASTDSWELVRDNGLSVIIETVQLRDTSYTYKIETWMPAGRESLIEIWVGTSFNDSSMLVEGIAWEKISKDTIRILGTPNNNQQLYILPKVPGTWYGHTMLVEKLFPIYLKDNSFGNLDLSSNTTTYTFDLTAVCLMTEKRDLLTHGTVGVDQCLAVVRDVDIVFGFAYPSELLNPIFTQELLAVYKRVEDVYLWFEQRNQRINYDGMTRDAGDPSWLNNLEFKYASPTRVTASIFQNDSRRGATETLTNNASEYNEGNLVLFKTSLQRVGYAYNLYLWTVFYCSLAAYQIVARVQQGTGFISAKE